jgi:hypothetical protein
MGLKRLRDRDTHKKHASLSVAVGDPLYPESTASEPVLLPWYRNPSWIDMPTMTSADQKYSILYGVNDTTDNFLRIYVNGTGTHTIDWGDGTVETHTGALWRDHQYDWSATALANTDVPVTFGSNTVTLSNHGYTNDMRVSFYTSTISDIDPHVRYWIVNTTTNTFQLSNRKGGTPITIGSGTGTVLPFKQAMVEITSDGDITAVQYNSRHPSCAFNYDPGIKEIEASIPNANYIHSGDSGQQHLTSIERYKIHKYTPTNITYCFREMYSLEHVDINFGNVTATDAVYLFYYNRSLTEINGLDTLTLNGRTHSMFSGLTCLREVPRLASPVNANNTQLLNTFNSCYRLKTIPDAPEYTTISSNTTNISAVYASTYNLLHAPYIDTTSSSTTMNMSSVYASARSLRTVPYINTTKGHNLHSFYNSCYVLREFPEIDFQNVNSTDSHTFVMAYMYSIDEIKFKGTSHLNSINEGWFYENTNRAVNMYQDLDFSNTLEIERGFYNNFFLKNLGTIVTSSTMNNTYQLFNQCWNLKSINSFDTSGVTNSGYMFSNCRRLNVIPYYDMSSTTNTYAWSTNNHTLKRCDTYDFSSSTDCRSMFYNNYLLEKLPDNLDISATTRADSTFRHCDSIEYADVNIPVTTNLNYLFYTGKKLERININAPLATTGAYPFTYPYGGYNKLKQITGDLSSMNNNQTTYTYAMWTSKLEVTHNNSIDLRYLNMSGQTLDNLYTHLPTVSGKTINITSNRGAGEDTPSIATAKGWTVTG